MAIEREVLEFIIVPPFEQREAVATAKDRLADYLERRFPGYRFKIGPFAPVGDEETFCILPVMNFLGDDGKSYMCDEPKRWFVQEIADACQAFDLHGVRSCAA
ncbi:hypothetical protein REJC140_00153 [Pseudorhizobium endolithicum]|uniref:Uncharacterized protein n=1 Tax=Pseudorhizobium endolithicum TaxID=1191678 RepID=A0ABM8PCS6_9HYPH|nr:hypothetical protein [Pseudorhizobium endolithicum]CAD7023280.1 hypothetical protein REJC140_00153 [Pseudorhizobium endolithicum]